MFDIDAVITKYLQGISNSEEDSLLSKWIKESTENEAYFFSMKDAWDTAGYHFNSKHYNEKQEMAILRSALQKRKTMRILNFRQLVGYAAAVAVAFTLGWAFQYFGLGKQKEVSALSHWKEVVVPRGMVNQVFLADGTRIWVNSGSRLTIPTDISGKERVVALKGEAFFEVAKDKSRPFKVNVHGQEVEVLGTSFNVRAYENSDEVETTLQEGKVKLTVGSSSFFLKPGDQSVLNLKNRKVEIHRVEVKNYSTWKEGRFLFENAAIADVFKMVERWYDVNITYDTNAFKGMHFSGVIKRYKDEKYFLDLLNRTIPISYTINQQDIKISLKK